MLPSQVPGEHRVALMRRLVNGELTTYRLQPVIGCSVLPCPFCGAVAASVAHRDSCATLRLVRSQIYATMDFEVMEQHTWLQTELTGAAHLQQTLAYLAAAIRLRRVLIDGPFLTG